LALIPGLLTDDANAVADAKELERLALWILQRTSPIVAVDAPDGIVIDSTGADHLHGGEQAMLEGIVGRLAMSGVTARAVVADTWGAAHALARCGTTATFIAPAGEGPRLLRRLPLEALRVTPTLAAKLRPMGFETIGDLLDQPRAPLTLRFGPEIALRIDQALGNVPEPIVPIRSPDVICRAHRRRRDDRKICRQAGG
jgi:protein ImuB